MYAACGFAQGVALSLSSGSGTPGQSVVLNLSLDATGNLPESTQWTLNYSAADFTSATFALGSANSDKQFSCSNGTGTTTCLVWGLNSTIIPNNVLASVTLDLSGFYTRTLLHRSSLRTVFRPIQLAPDPYIGKRHHSHHTPDTCAQRPLMQPDVADAIRRIHVYGYADIRGGERRGHNRAERVASGRLHSPFRNRSARIHFDDLRG